MIQTDDFNHHFAEEYLKTLDNKDYLNPRAIITFSGIPGSGKTTLARRLTQDLNAQYVHGDGIRELIRIEGEKPEKYAIVPIGREVMKHILDTDGNKRIVLDASIDRSWLGFFEDSKNIFYVKPIIIRFDIPHGVLRQRQLSRDGQVNPKFDTYIEQFEECKRSVPADIELSDEYNYDEVLSRLKELLR